MRNVLIIATTLFCLAACNRAAPPAAPSADNVATPATHVVPTVVAPATSVRATPAPSAANLAMQRAAEGPRVVLRPCSTLSGDAYEQCKAENAAAIARAQGTQPEAH